MGRAHPRGGTSTLDSTLDGGRDAGSGDVRRGPVDLPSDQDASGRSFGATELRFLEDVIESGTLTSTKGSYVKGLEAAFAATIGASHVTACSSGTAAVHAAIAAVDPEPGDEVITTAITDMGALTPIVYQGAIPVFADVDPATGNVTPETVADRISDRTRAIVVTHLFGNPADIHGIMHIASRHGIPVIEDAAQAYGARVGGRPVGSIADIGCFSLQQGKHITTGEGGLVVTSDDALARRIRLFVNKAWPYGEQGPDHEFLALNYRMSELQGAVGLGQLARLDGAVRRRIEHATMLGELLDPVPGVGAPLVADDATHSYWRYCLRIDRDVIPGGPDAVASRLSTYDIASAPRYVKKPAFECAVIRDQRTFGDSRWPFVLADEAAVDYRPERFPGTYEALSSMLVLPFNERYGCRHVEYVASAIAAAVKAGV